MKLKDWLVPRQERFFDLLNEQAAIVAEGAQAFSKSLAESKGTAEFLREQKRVVKEIEHRGDQKTHEIFTALNATFITPLDREDIATLASALDDILDFTYATANHLQLYEIQTPPKVLTEIAMMLRDQTMHLQACIRDLGKPARREELQAHLIEIHNLENQADDLTNRAKADLFHETDVRYILKMKDILEYLETATDKCEDAADVVRDVLVKHQ
jgi:predicted phosphate transport protein (TIGR00153 family)